MEPEFPDGMTLDKLPRLACMQMELPAVLEKATEFPPDNLPSISADKMKGRRVSQQCAAHGFS
jgi:hypothetical protein